MDKLENKITFEEALGRLEEIVRMLESGSAPLDKSLELFEHARVENCGCEYGEY